MYDFWYNHIKAEYGNMANLLYTDTDSLLFQVETEDVYANMKTNAIQYDFSDYPIDHPNHSIENKKVVGKFKDECCSRPITEFVGLRPKMYSILEVNGANIRKAKGVQKTVVKKDLRHELYKQCPDEHKEMKHKQIVIRSRGHQMGVYEQNKTSLSPLDTKKWIAKAHRDQTADLKQWRGLLCHFGSSYYLRRLLASQSCRFIIQRGHNGRQPGHPLS